MARRCREAAAPRRVGGPPGCALRPDSTRPPPPLTSPAGHNPISRHQVGGGLSGIHPPSWAAARPQCARDDVALRPPPPPSSTVPGSIRDPPPPPEVRHGTAPWPRGPLGGQPSGVRRGHPPPGRPCLTGDLGHQHRPPTVPSPSPPLPCPHRPSPEGIHPPRIARRASPPRSIRYLAQPPCLAG